MKTYTMLITPEIAAEMMTHNAPFNRPISQEKVKFFSKHLQAGTFVLNHQGIAFSESGLLLDGQHRLTAIIKTGIPATIQVTEGLPEGTFLAIDTTGRRKARDQYKAIGETDSVILDNNVIGTVNAFWKYYMGYSDSIDYFDTLDMEKAIYPEICDIFKSSITSSKARPTCRINASLLAARLCGVPADAIAAFAKCYCRNDISSEYNCKAVLDAKDYFNLTSRYRESGESDRAERLQVIENAIYCFYTNRKGPKKGMRRYTQAGEIARKRLQEYRENK